jgi:hypothetical protein
MKILTNKYFILGNLLLLLISIPVTLFFIKRQQELRSQAAPSSKLFFSPESPTTSTQCSSFTSDVMVDPGTNIISIVDFYIKYDPTKLDVLEIKESAAFPTVVRPTSITSGEANMSVSVGSDVTKAIQTITKVATITFRPKVQGPAQIQFDSEKSRVFSLAPADEPTENVLFSVSPSNVNITSGPCPGVTGTPGPTGTTTISPTGQIQPTGTGTSPTPIRTTTTAPSPTTSVANQAPLCTEFSVSPSSTGSAPFSVLFTAKGNDPDTGGSISKTTFNFGDGQVQDVTEGMNLKNVTVQTNHTYQNAGTFGAIVTFTDNSGAISQSCTKTLTVTGATGSATTTPTTTPTSGSAQLTSTPTSVPTSAPTIPPSGGITQTLGIVGFVILTIIGGFILLAL